MGDCVLSSSKNTQNRQQGATWAPSKFEGGLERPPHSEVGLDGLSDRPPADGARDRLLLQKGPLADLADAEVPAGQDHDALLSVLADHAQLVLALALHLKR